MKDLNNVNPDIEVLGKYINSMTPILVKCKIDGYEWNAVPSRLLIGRGCPACNESNGERQIRQWLEKNHIQYECQKIFKDCKGQKCLPFDFYLPRLQAVIEYDGQQHFKPIDFAGRGDEWAKSQFETIQQHDQIKTEYCKRNNMELIRVPYFYNVEDTLNKFLLN